MSFISKIKNILFEEEIIEEPVNVKEEVKISETIPKKTIEQPEKKPPLFDLIDDDPIIEEPKREKISFDEESERELFKLERTFNFPVFDEDEFESSVPRVRSSNVLAKEKPARKPDKRLEYPRYERNERVEDKKKFKPSPIISPVYGILDKNYRKEEVITKKEIKVSSTNYKKIDVDSVRNKAFGQNESEEKVEKKKEVKVEPKKEEQRVYDINKSKPSADNITLADADEYYNDLGLAYNVDYSDSSRSQLNTRTKRYHEDKEKDYKSDDNLFDLIDSMYSKED